MKMKGYIQFPPDTADADVKMLNDIYKQIAMFHRPKITLYESLEERRKKIISYGGSVPPTREEIKNINWST